MLTGAAHGALEVRAETDGGARLSGRFPYGAVAELAKGRSEVFAPGSLEPRGNVYLLAQHRFETPLASTDSGGLELHADDDALRFEARLSPEVVNTSHGRDALALIRSGLAVGISPGFRVPTGGERVERHDGGLMRTVTRAELHELSIVTRPAFEAAQVEARCWQAPQEAGRAIPAAWRWR
ncbi:HK97 family phage prohead protease [Spectribacter hydrogenoxidans]|uniref:HK97 family phage prohead protease n=1 Tax=Spectribacter hydrogenoxidans TaxID=3075608 RepID=A0ABU3C0J3_9GAMM|nr:HK97 family phage prohead protease [Salinisphaera sp. W335]MDT0635048.1 HK97 family phage prohead protease [Salinisphaera sp. W335]